MIGGTTTARAAILIADLETASDTFAWAAYLMVAHRKALDLQTFFTSPELYTISLVAPRGNIIQFAGDPSSTAPALTPILDVDVTPALTEEVRAPKGVRFVGTGLLRLRDWRTFLSYLVEALPSTKPKLLSHSGHDSVSILTFDTPLG